MKYLIELDLADGGGEHSTYHYYLINTNHYPIENHNELTQEALDVMNSRYSYGINSGYHNWKVIEKGVAAKLIYDMYLLTIENMEDLKRHGIKLPGGFDR